MKHKSKSAFLTVFSFVLAVLALTACDSIKWPHVYGPDEVPQEVKDAPRKVNLPPPTEADETYPRLGDVPSRPKDFASPSAIDKTKREMEGERQKAGQILQNKDQ
jgi:hypothetical protein